MLRMTIITGIISIFFMMGAFVNGTLALWAPEIRRWIKPVYSKWFHNCIGIIAFVIGMASIRFSVEISAILIFLQILPSGCVFQLFVWFERLSKSVHYWNTYRFEMGCISNSCFDANRSHSISLRTNERCYTNDEKLFIFISIGTTAEGVIYEPNELFKNCEFTVLRMSLIRIDIMLFNTFVVVPWFALPIGVEIFVKFTLKIRASIKSRASFLAFV